MLISIGRWARRWAASSDPWTNVYGLARSVLATGTALTLLFNRTTTLFRPAVGIENVPYCAGVRAGGLFCLATSHHLSLELARWVAIALLVLVASGWRPRITGALHWWVSVSFLGNALLLDGGDSVAAIMTLLLLPVTLTDSRKSHWAPPRNAPSVGREETKRIVALFLLTVIRVQVAGIYFHAAIAKFSVKEWANGTALYYWVNHPLFGATGLTEKILQPLVVNRVTVTILTFSVLVLEYSLSTALVMPKRFWRYMLALGLGFHVAIMALHGLVTFSMMMFAALVLYLRPVEQPFARPTFALARRVVGRLRRRPVPAEEAGRPATAPVRSV